MYEKYNAMVVGQGGGGGEYGVQSGFGLRAHRTQQHLLPPGWTNGVILSLLAERPGLDCEQQRV